MFPDIPLTDGNEIIGTPEHFEKSRVRFHGKRSRLIFHPGVRCIGANFDLHDLATIEIFAGVVLRGSLLAHHSCSIAIGENTRCNDNLNIRTAEGTRVTVGKNCLIARATIRSSDMHPIYDLVTDERLNPGEGVEIGDHVWMAQDVFITKGVKVGAGSVLAAFAVVTKDVPESSIAAGNPARVVRSGIRWDANLPLKSFRAP